MSVELSGNSPAALTAGILLLSRARQFGQRLLVSVMGDPDQITPVQGPALVHSAVLASCGVGSRPDGGAVVVVPGPSESPLAVCLDDDGAGSWFTVDRAGRGEHPATQALVRLCRSPHPQGRRLGRELLQGLGGLGCMAEPAVIDLTLRAPISPYHRVVLGLLAGHSLRTGRRVPLHDFLGPATSSEVQLPDELTLEAAIAAHTQGLLDEALLRVKPEARPILSTWIGGMLRHASVDPDAATVICTVLDTLAPVLTMPEAAVLPTLSPAADGVANALPAAIGAQAGASDAARGLVDTFCFLGGTFVDYARFPVVISGDPAPNGRLERWRWFCESTRSAADTADALWRRVVDPVQ